MFMAFVLGGGPMADAFFVAFRLPNVLRRMFGEGSLSLAFVPLFSKARKSGGDTAAFALFRAVALRLALLLGGVCLLGVVFAPECVRLVAPGLPPESEDAAAFLLRLCLPYALFVSLAGLCMALLNAFGAFAIPALAPAVFNLCLLAGAAWAWSARWMPAPVLACAVALGGFMQLCMQLPALWRLGAGQPGPMPSAREVRDSLRGALSGAFGASSHQMGVLVGTIIASFLAEGSISALYYAERLVEFPLGVFGVALGTATLPALSGFAAAGRPADFDAELSRSLRLALFVNLPAAAGLVAVARPLVGLIFGHGAFGIEAVDAAVAALVAYAPGLPAFALTRILLAASHARGDSAAPVRAAAIAIVVVGVVGVPAALLLGVSGPPLACSLGAWCNVLLLWRALHRAGTRPQLAWRGVACQVGLSLLVLGVAWSVALFGLDELLTLAAGVAAGCMVYFSGALLTSSRELAELMHAARGTRALK